MFYPHHIHTDTDSHESVQQKHEDLKDNVINDKY